MHDTITPLDRAKSSATPACRKALGLDTHP